ncbi:MAG: hypothetical protein Q9187_006552 [Circinaria calcarea]
MTSSAPGASGLGEDRQGLSKFMRRASKVLKGGSKRGSISSATETPLASASEATPTPRGNSSSKVTTAMVIPSSSSFAAIPPPNSALLSKTAGKPIERATRKVATTAAESYSIQEERARTMFAKYGLTLEPGEWTPPTRGDAERVEKKIRMRVHRQCHRCQTTFGPEKVCVSCEHTRCKKCPRFPTKRPKDPQAADTKIKVVAPMAALMPLVDLSMAPNVIRAKAFNTNILIKPSKTGQDLVRKAPMHRATQCSICQHERCPTCPRDPPKLNKWPNGYPGDKEETYPLAERQLRAIRTRIRWECHSCKVMFKDHEKTCGSCQHRLCDQCKRHPPKRVKLQPDEGVVKSMEEKLAKVNLHPAT